MSTAPTAKPGGNSLPAAAKKAAGNPFRMPPEEQFWKRYSPHYEAPISLTGSTFIHLLLIGLALALFILGWKLGQGSTIEFQAVRMPGGGGGNPNGQGDAPNLGAPFVEDKGQDKNDPTDITLLLDNPPLDATQLKEAREKFPNDDDAQRYINAGNENIASIARNLNKGLLDKIHSNMTPGKGAGGPGTGGGEGTGHGTGTGPSVGSGKGTLNEREKRMLRWVMIFETRDPNDYIKQLAGLGAIVAVPIGPNEYKVVDDLNARPAKLVAKDVAGLNRIYWVDDKANSVRGVLEVLKLNVRANHFVAFMPQDLEEKLGAMEREEARGLSEDEIFETKFKVLKTADGYKVKVQSVARK